MMVRVIMGIKGTGKTKQMIDLISAAAKEASGSVVCIEQGNKMTYDIPSSVRLVEASEFAMHSYDFMQGFISGLYAGNYDITHIFIDSLTKMIPSDAGDAQTEAFLLWMDKFSEKNGIKVVITISADSELANETVKQFF